MSWSLADALWTVDNVRGAGQEPARFTCNFLFGRRQRTEHAAKRGQYQPARFSS